MSRCYISRPTNDGHRPPQPTHFENRRKRRHRHNRLVLIGSLFAFLGVVFVESIAAQDAAGQLVPRARPQEAGMSSERLERISRLMQKYIDENRLAGTVTLIARRGKVVYFDARGHRHAEEKAPMTKDTIFRIMSMTKPIVSVALMTLFEEGKFALDDPVSKWIPAYADVKVAVKAPGDERIAAPYKLVPAARPITVRHLLTHTAGLPNSYRGLTRGLYRQALLGEGKPPRTVEESMLRTAKVPLNFHPGDEWEYGRATDVVGVLVEKISGMSLDEFLRVRIFEPLKMHDTFFNIPESKINRLAALYHPDENGKIKLRRAPKYSKPTRYFSGAGGLASTAADYFRFHQMMLNGGELDGVRILGRKTVNLMITNHIGKKQVWLKGPGYGFGLGYSVLLDAGKASEHLSPGSFGWGGAYNTFFFVDPSEEMIGIFMTQIRPYTHLDVRRQTTVLATGAIIDGPSLRPPTIMGYRPRK